MFSFGRKIAIKYSLDILKNRMRYPINKWLWDSCICLFLLSFDDAGQGKLFFAGQAAVGRQVWNFKIWSIYIDIDTDVFPILYSFSYYTSWPDYET